MKTIYKSLNYQKFTLVFAFVFGITFSSWGLVKTPSEKKFEGVNLTKTLSLPEIESGTLQPVAHGLRKKSVAFIGVRVYVGELLLPPKVNWDQQVKTFEQSPSAAISMTFLRDVSAKNINDAFKDGLKENKINLETDEIKKFFTSVKNLGDIKKNESLIIARNQHDGKDQLLVAIPNRIVEVITGPAGWTDQILKIWTGQPSDSGIKDMQKAFFK